MLVISISLYRLCADDNGPSLGALGRKLYAPSYVPWTEYFNVNPMLMAQIQAGMKLENRQNPNQHIKRLLDYNHGKRTEIIDYLPNSYYQTRVQRF